MFWLLLGVGVGMGTSFWVLRIVKETAARYAPERVSADMANAVKEMGQNLRLAVADGRQAMQTREAELRSEFGPTR